MEIIQHHGKNPLVVIKSKFHSFSTVPFDYVNLQLIDNGAEVIVQVGRVFA